MAIKSLARSTIRQAQRVNSALAGYESNYFHHLETVRLGGNAASVTFSNLDRYSDFQHLQLRYVLRTDRASVPYSNGALRLNGDTGSNYNAHYLVGTGSAVSSGFVSSATSMLIGNQPGGTFTTSAFAAGIFDFLDAYDTTKFTTVRCLSGHTGNDTTVSLQSGLWRNTAAVTSITVLNWDSANLAAGSRFSLYGLKAKA